jgi:hypothetical protein
MSGRSWKFEVTENGKWVAGGDCTDENFALGEAAHYVRVYGQDGGDVRALVWTGRKPRSITKVLPTDTKTLENKG